MDRCMSCGVSLKSMREGIDLVWRNMRRIRAPKKKKIEKAS